MRAEKPFQFVAASYLVRIGGQRAQTLRELAEGLRACPEASIFYHTFQSLETHHYASFSNDFAQWTLTACNEAALAELLAVVDLREIASIAELRAILTDSVEVHLRDHAASADRKAYEPFYFCESREITVPFGPPVWTLAEMADGIRLLGHQSLHYHFISSRLRPPLRMNDFSAWIEHSLGMPRLAAQLNWIDFYNDTLDDLRRELLALIEPRPVR